MPTRTETDAPRSDEDKEPITDMDHNRVFLEMVTMNPTLPDAFKNFPHPITGVKMPQLAIDFMENRKRKNGIYIVSLVHLKDFHHLFIHQLTCTMTIDEEPAEKYVLSIKKDDKPDGSAKKPTRTAKTVNRFNPCPKSIGDKKRR